MNEINDTLTDILGDRRQSEYVLLALSRRGYRIMPKEPTPAMVAAGAKHRLTTEIGKANTWTADTATLYTVMMEQAP
jgi:hypothetical protein